MTKVVNLLPGVNEEDDNLHELTREDDLTDSFSISMLDDFSVDLIIMIDLINDI